jgi:hypothetical protein
VALKKMTFHQARDTFATNITLTNGVSIETVSKMQGYRNLKTTMRGAEPVPMARQPSDVLEKPGMQVQALSAGLFVAFLHFL